MSRILHCSPYFSLDSSNGAAIANRILMGSLGRDDFSVEALCGPIVDYREGGDPAAFFAGSNPLAPDWEATRSYSWLLGSPGVRLSDPPNLRAVIDGIPVTALHRPLRRGGTLLPREAEEFLSLYDATFERFQPQILVTYGGDALTLELLRRARRARCSTVFTLHNFSYQHAEFFDDVDYVLVPSRFASEHHRRTIGIETINMRCMVDPARACVDEVDPIYVTFVNPSVEKGAAVFARIADELGRRRPDIPFLVVESRASESDLVAFGLDLRVIDNVSLMSQTSDPRHFWGVTRICLVPSLFLESQCSVAVEAMMNGIPVIGSDRGALPETLGSAGIALTLPERLTPNERSLPTPAEVGPWVDAIVGLHDDRRFYEEHRKRALEESQGWRPEVLLPAYRDFFSDIINTPR